MIEMIFFVSIWHWSWKFRALDPKSISFKSSKCTLSSKRNFCFKIQKSTSGQQVLFAFLSFCLFVFFNKNITFLSLSQINRGQSNDSSFIKLKSKDSNQITQSTILIRFLTEKRWHIFWILVFYLLLIDLFLCKAYCLYFENNHNQSRWWWWLRILFKTCSDYTFEQNHNGIWNICGFSLPVSRASAYTLMFCFALLLLTMCRNLITFFRETFVHRFVPFDSAVVFHKHVAICVFLLSSKFSLIHILIWNQSGILSSSCLPKNELSCSFDSPRNQLLFNLDSISNFTQMCIPFGFHCVS